MILGAPLIEPHYQNVRTSSYGLLPAYHMLDVGFNFRKTTKRGNESVWNLSVYNLYCRMNPIFASYLYDNIDNVTKRYFKHTSVIPIVPSFSYTLRF